MRSALPGRTGDSTRWNAYARQQARTATAQAVKVVDGFPETKVGLRVDGVRCRRYANDCVCRFMGMSLSG